MIPRLHDDRGFTLVELLMTMSILSLVMALITGTTIFMQRSINQTDQRFDDLSQARVAMDATSRWVRSAITVERASSTIDTQPFAEARRSRVDLIANIGVGGASAAPRRVVLEVVSGNQLREQVWRGTIDAAGEWAQSGSPTTRILARGLTDTRVFTFFDADGNDLTPASDTALTEAVREQVRRVGIAISVRQAPNVGVPASQLTTRVTLPNQFYFDAEGGS